LLSLLGCSGQANYVRVYFLAFGEVQTISYFDYDPVAKIVLRIQTIDDQALIGMRGVNGAVTSTVVCDDINAYFVLFIADAFGIALNYLMVQNHGSCLLTQYSLVNSAQEGITVDPINRVVYYNYMSNGNNSNIPVYSGIGKINVDGTNPAVIYQYPTIGKAHWLSIDTTKQLLYASASSYQFFSLNLGTNATTKYSQQGCQAATCDINVLNGVVDPTTERVYYPDSSGLLAFNPSTNSTTRVLLFSTPQIKSLTIDTQNNLIFFQTYGVSVGGQTVGSIYVVSVNLTSSIANLATLNQIPGVVAIDVNNGNLLSLAHCDGNGACGLCGFPYTNPFSAAKTVVVASAVQTVFSMTLLVVVLLVILLF